MMRFKWKKFFSMLLVFMLVITSDVLPVFAQDASEDTAVEGEIMTLKPDMTEGSWNKFSYTAYQGKEWSVLENEAYMDLGSSDERAEECYYEIPFVGNKVEIFSNKSPMQKSGFL